MYVCVSYFLSNYEIPKKWQRTGLVIDLPSTLCVKSSRLNTIFVPQVHIFVLQVLSEDGFSLGPFQC